MAGYGRFTDQPVGIRAETVDRSRITSSTQVGADMRMIAGCILILAGSVLLAAYWLGQVIHRSVVTGSPEAMYLLAAAVLLGLFGGAVAAIGLVTERIRP
jgi:hypothetical protein